VAGTLTDAPPSNRNRPNCVPELTIVLRGLLIDTGRRERRRPRGAAAVEFALVAPVALLFVLGSIEFGRAMFLQHVAVNAARTACRQGILSSSSTATVQATASQMLEAVGIAGATTSVVVSRQTDLDVSAAAPGEPIAVIVTIPFGQNSWLPNAMYLGSKSLTGQVTMAKE
jgi:Flp pilus assembly protein TadG